MAGPRNKRIAALIVGKMNLKGAKPSDDEKDDTTDSNNFDTKDDKTGHEKDDEVKRKEALLV